MCKIILRGTHVYLIDIDECSDGSDDCDDKALCENTEGSHTCTCNQGYSGTGLICTGMYLTWLTWLLMIYIYKS